MCWGVDKMDRHAMFGEVDAGWVKGGLFEVTLYSQHYDITVILIAHQVFTCHYYLCPPQFQLTDHCSFPSQELAMLFQYFSLISLKECVGITWELWLLLGVFWCSEASSSSSISISSSSSISNGSV